MYAEKVYFFSLFTSNLIVCIQKEKSPKKFAIKQIVKNNREEGKKYALKISKVTVPFFSRYASDGFTVYLLFHG